MDVHESSTNDISCSVQQIQAADRFAIEQLGIPGLILMENAGRGVAEITRSVIAQDPEPRVTILCGPGNNGGDGFVLARHLLMTGIPSIVVLAADRVKSRGDADVNLRIVERLGLPIADATTPDGLAEARDAISGATVIVDALLGTGSSGPPRDPMGTLISLANAASGRRIAVDLPSGLDADSGEVSTPCFRADITVTLLARKLGMSSNAAKGVLGNLQVCDIGVALDQVLPENLPNRLDG